MLWKKATKGRRIMNLIVCADRNWAIGNNNKLLVSIPKDMKSFREMTTGKVIVIGRKTLATFPGGRPLDSRTNIIMSRDKNYKVAGAVVVHSTEELLKELEKYDSRDVYVCGGESVYKELLPYCDTAHVTRVDHSYAADTYFPNLDKSDEWEIAVESDEEVYFDVTYTFVKYVRK